MGNLYFIIKMEHNVLGLANLLGSGFFVYCNLGIQDRLTFQLVYFRHDRLEAYLWDLRYNLTAFPAY